MFKKTAFTLAETLICIVIIGVIAALVVPSVLQNYKKRETSTALKKFYSTMTQAITLSELENGPSESWPVDVAPRDDKGVLIPEESREYALNYFNEYLSPYLKTIKIDDNPEELQNEDGEANAAALYLLDGSVVYINHGWCIDFKVDVNGDKKPNENGRDRFVFVLCPESKRANYCFKDEKLCSYSIRPTREEHIATCKSTPTYCSSLLMLDNFEFKSDYPYKL